MWFKSRAEAVGFPRAVQERDGGAPVAPDVARPTLRRTERAKLWAAKRGSTGGAGGVSWGKMKKTDVFMENLEI